MNTFETNIIIIKKILKLISIIISIIKKLIRSKLKQVLILILMLLFLVYKFPKKKIPNIIYKKISKFFNKKIKSNKSQNKNIDNQKFKNTNKNSPNSPHIQFLYTTFLSKLSEIQKNR